MEALMYPGSHVSTAEFCMALKTSSPPKQTLIKLSETAETYFKEK